MPSVQSLTPILRRGFGDLLLERIVTGDADPILTAPKLRLQTTPSFSLNPDSSYIEVSSGEADFSGYPAGGAPITWLGPLRTADYFEGLIFNKVFVVAVDDPQVSNNITGWFISDGSEWVCGTAFAGAAVVPMAYPGDFIDLLAGLSVSLAPYLL